MSGKARFVPVNRRNARKRAKKRGIVRFLPGKMRVRAVRLAAVRRDEEIAHRCAQFAAKNAEKSEKAQNCAAFARKMRVCTVCPVAVRRDEEIARRRAQFAVKNAEKSEKTRNCAVFARKRRVCAVCPVAVRQGGEIVRWCALFEVKNAIMQRFVGFCAEI